VLLAISDATGGIAVRLPSGAAAPARGALVDVEGPLARPYGQLEIRPAATGLSVVGSAPLPTPVPIGAGGLGETDEGRLVVVDGRLAAKPSRAASGDLTFRLVAAGGASIKVAADASSRIDRASLAVGAEYRVTGIAGQRATRSGALDGYRMWARDPADLTMLRPPPSPTARPSSTPRPTATPRPSSSGSPTAVLSIAAATRITNRDVIVEGVVTAPASLLDTTGRRIVVQDATAAIEVLLPKDRPAPRTGRRIRVEGRIGTAYGSPRLRADSVDDRGAGAEPSPRVLRGAVASGLAWRLVRVEGRIEDIRKLGDRWRAEIRVGRDRVVVVGQPGAGIPAAALIEGRTATITGIVRLAFPTATDRRPSVLPRTRADVRVSVGGPATAGSTGTTSGVAAQGSGPGSGSVSAGAAASPSVPDADLAELAASEGRTVRVGGLVRAVRADGFELDDGTATGRVVLAGEAAAWIALIEPGDAINVVGRVERRGGALAVVVEDPATITLGSDLPAPAASERVRTGPDGSAAAAARWSERHAGLTDGLSTLPGAGAGLATLAGLVVTSLAVTFLRRRHAQRLLASRIAVRLGAVTRSPERDPSVGPPV
jgi:DNA/RNA endonuclease YhcR with UshA esterase domain